MVRCFCLGLSDAIYDMRPAGQDRSDALGSAYLGYPCLVVRLVPRPSKTSVCQRFSALRLGFPIGHPNITQSQERDSPRYRYHWLSGPLSVSHIMTKINLAHPSPRLSHSVSDRCRRR